MEVIQSCLRWHYLASADISGVLVLFMALAIRVDVFLRYVFNAPTIWINEASRFSLLIVTFLGLAYTRREDAHIRVDFVTKRLPRQFQDWARVDALDEVFCRKYLGGAGFIAYYRASCKKRCKAGFLSVGGY